MSPIYTYECPGCGKKFDKRVAMAEMDEYQLCPGLVVDLGNDAHAEMPELVPCGAPSKRCEVPSSPASFIMH